MNIRDALSLPSGDNATDTLINTIHYNSTTLNYWNFTFYPGNGTISNGSSCWLVFDAYKPLLLPNGTFINATTCYFPYYSVSSRGTLGIVFSSLFAFTIMLTILNLGKHGKLYLPQEKRFHAIGRRWQWYWMFFVAGCGIISCISAIDVDRDYLQGTAIVLENFFFYLMVPGILAVVWEGVRHWGSWQERQIYDREPFSLPQKWDLREQKEFYLPLVFYLFAWLNFFMNIPRTWTSIQSQSDNRMTNTIAKPWAQDVRFKGGAIFACLAWLTILVSLQHSIHFYKPRHRGIFNRTVGFFRSIPIQFYLTIPILGLTVGYAVASAWTWNINIGRLGGDSAWYYGMGYAPAIAILFINSVAGIFYPNEDKALIRQRVQRGHSIDEELGLYGARKPAWWKPVADYGHTTEQRLKALTTEVGGGRATANNISETIELNPMPARPGGFVAEDEGGNVLMAAIKRFRDPFKDEVASPKKAIAGFNNGQEEEQRPLRPEERFEIDEQERRRGLSRNDSRDSTYSIGGTPQVVKSMLDF
ncbi:hypothetical protein MMC25_002358 [Agyrium rufum]|nr:hypothetical protein [Agyrium rufum]